MSERAILKLRFPGIGVWHMRFDVLLYIRL